MTDLIQAIGRPVSTNLLAPMVGFRSPNTGTPESFSIDRDNVSIEGFYNRLHPTGEACLQFFR
jgi:hypothetical protein